MNDQIAEIRLIAESWSPQQVLAWPLKPLETAWLLRRPSAQKAWC